FVNENLALDSMALQPDPHRYVHAEHCPAPLRLLVFIEGAPDPAASLLRAAQREHEVVLLPPPGEADLRAFGEALQLERFDLVICHGWASHRGVELADVWRKPSLWLVPEEELPALAEGSLAAPMRRATRVCFSSRATARRFAHANDRDHHRILDGDELILRLMKEAVLA